MKLPTQYVVQKFYAFARRPKYNQSGSSYQTECTYCREGKSRGKKRRLYYFPEQGFFLCYNCSKSWNAAQWVHEVTGLDYSQIRQEVEEGDFDTAEWVLSENTDFQRKINPYTLPQDCINLCDSQQVTFYKNEQVVQDALQFIENRRLNTAINKPDKFWLSLKDFIHKNRVIIPFYDPDNQIRFYQSRAIYPKDEDIAKYLSKINSEKTIYGVNNVNSDLDYLFLFEGPIDAMFVQNGLGITGLKLTDHQRQILQKYSLFKQIWVLDNQLDNQDVKKQYENLIEEGQQVFFWPEKYKAFKDVNELCVKLGLDQIKPEFFTKNSYSGSEAQLKLASLLNFSHPVLSK